MDPDEFYDALETSSFGGGKKVCILNLLVMQFFFEKFQTNLL